MEKRGNKCRPGSRRLCCVSSCRNSYANTPQSVKFYTIPNKSYETRRREIWIQRINEDSRLHRGKLRNPSKYDLICSQHFIGNKKSNIESHPSYNPTIFDNMVYMQRRAFPTSIVPFENITIKKSDDHRSKCDDEKNGNGFHEFKGIRNDEEMINICGISLKVFNLLLSLFTSVDFNDKLCVENQLLLFLMKLKLGLSNRALGVLFNVDANTVLQIFLHLLNELAHKTADHSVHWPDHKNINANMLQLHYPQTRVTVADCTEIIIENLKSADNMNTYKGNFTAKFLIGVTPNDGFISLVSKACGGKISDSLIINNCVIPEKLKSDELILADKKIVGVKYNASAVTVLPHFVHRGIMEVNVNKNKNVFSIGAQVERSLQRVQIYKILQKIPYNLFPHIDEIIFICCVLMNLQLRYK